MKAIDFTKPGGFPLTQDQLGYLQQAYTEATIALASMGGDSSTPFRVSGMAVSSPSTGSYDITAGWFCYNDELVKCEAGSISGASGSSDAFIVISPLVTSLVYNDGSTPGVVLDKTATLQVLPSSTATDATHFPLSSLLYFGQGLGPSNREAGWNVLSVSTAVVDGGVTGDVYYKKDFLTNTLHMRGALSAGNAQNFAAMPGSLFYLMGTLPAAYIPANNTYFTAQYFVASSVLDSTGTVWIKQVNCALNASGQLYINWMKPEISIVGYGVNFNVLLPLG